MNNHSLKRSSFAKFLSLALLFLGVACAAQAFTYTNTGSTYVILGYDEITVTKITGAQTTTHDSTVVAPGASFTADFWNDGDYFHVYTQTSVTVIATPTATLTADQTTFTIGGSTVIHAVFSGGTYTGTRIDSPLGTTITSTDAQASRDYSFHPTATGQYRFYALANAQYYPWAYYALLVVTVQSVPPTINTQPISQTVAIASNQPTVTFTCAASGGSNLTYTWQYSDNNWASLTTLSGNSTSLIVQPSVGLNSRQYRCHVSNSGGGAVNSNAVTATVTPPVATMTTDPTQPIVVVGNPATFSVNLSPALNATYQWSKNGSSISGAWGSSYTLANAALTDNGATFLVTVTYQSGGTQTLTASTILTVQKAPPPTVTGPADVLVTHLGTSAYFTVTAGPTIKNTYDWQVSTDGGSTWTDVTLLPDTSNYQGMGTATLTIVDPVINSTTRPMNGYKYRCIVGNGTLPNTTSTSATLTIQSGTLLQAPAAPWWISVPGALLLVMLAARLLPAKKHAA